MRKIFPLVTLIALLAVAISSCDSNLTYANQLDAEKQSIKDFISNNNYQVVDTIPSIVPWPTGVYYLTKSGLYVHVLDTGAYVNKAIQTNTVINVRFVETDMAGVTGYTNMSGTGNPVELLYNNVSTSATFGDCKAWHEGLTYVGDGGHVQMIVPASLGWSMYTSTAALTAKFYELRYTF
ncbi:MAG: DUF4827 family protein, partial [Bacteroidia bacterium]|nr:DUF4827 family protein [Bacteroidia bacterium]